MLLLLALLLTATATPGVAAQNVDPETAHLLERALDRAETMRQQFRTIEYDARMRVQEWDGRGRVRGTAKATAIMRPGATPSMIFVSRQVEGKVRLPDPEKKDEEEDESDTTLPQFARQHRIAERFDFQRGRATTVAGITATEVQFRPRRDFPAKDRVDRFLNHVRGAVWIAKDGTIVKFDMQLLKPFQLFWIIAVLKDLSVEYELLAPGDIIGRARLKISFALVTPIYSSRQLHEIEVDNFRRRQTVAAAAN